MQDNETKPEVLPARGIKLSESLASLIRTQGFTGNQKQIAKDVGVSEASLSHYLTGRSAPSFDKLLALADYFGVSLDYLVYGTAANSSPEPARDNDYLSRQMQRALNEAGRQSARRQDLTSRLASVMVDSLTRAVDDIVKQPLREESTRTITNDDAIALEEHATEVKIVSAMSNMDQKTGRQSGTTITLPDGSVQPGPFLSVQAENIRRGIRYSQIVQGPKDEWPARVSKLRSNLRNAGVHQEQLGSTHTIKGSEYPTVGTFVILFLKDDLTDDPGVQIIRERFRPYFRKDGLFAYISIMDDLFQGGFPLASRYRDNALTIFESMWKDAADL